MPFPTPSIGLVRRCVAVVVVALASRVAAAQTPLPTSDQARRLLETRPELVAQLRREIANSGLTPDQIRARLRAAGYPADLLDGYIAPGRGGRDSLTSIVPTDDVLDAVAALGMADTVDTSELRAMLKRRRQAMGGRDSTDIRGDTTLDRTRRRLRPSLLVGDSLDYVDSLDRIDRLDPRDRLAAVPRRATRPVVDTGLTIFGLNVFRSATTQFDPNLAGPVDASYRLGPGDRLVLIITGDAERAYNLDVTREGFIVVPGIGEISVANLTLGALEDVLYPKLGRVFSGLRRGADATTRFSINIARLHTNQVFVLGDVDEPGSYRVSSAGTALTALYAAGGPTATGSLRRVEIRRGGRIVDTLDLYAYFLHGDGSHDPRLQSGDVIFVPVHGARVRVYGEIVRPATYELRPGETVADLLQAAGGFTAEAARRRVQISRVLPPTQRDTTDQARVVIDISSDQFASGTGPAYRLEPGDVVRVFRVSERVARRVAVRGDVWTPGTVGFTAGMRLSEAIRLAGGIKPDAYLPQVLVSRLRPSDSVRVQLRTAFQDSTGRVADDIVLREDDEIRVFSVAEFQSRAYVVITGAVRKPGRVEYREGMTLRDLVLLAGGLDRRAYLGEAEIVRQAASREGGRLAVSQRVPLDSGYLLARLPSAHGSGVMQAGGPRDVTLEPFDNVLIFAQPEWDQPRRVIVTGEVRFPGTYTLVAKGERISDVLKRAGGLTAGAYPGGVAFYRRDGGRIGVDLARALRDSTYRDNLLLQDGDSIHLPQFSGVVDVQGAVNAPRGVAYVPGADLEYYVNAAGGASRKGDAKRAYVTQPDGSVETVVTRLLRPDIVPVPRPGAVIFVTETPATDKSDSAARLTAAAQIIASLVTLALVFRR